MCRVGNNTLRNYGVFLIVLGVLGILFGVICFSVCLSTIKYGAGPIWCGIFIVCTGICAYKGGKVDANESNRGWVGLFLALDIVSIVLSFASWCLAIAAVADDNEQYYACHNYGYQGISEYPGCLDSTNFFAEWYGKTLVPASKHSTSLGINSVNLIIAFIQFIVTFVFSIVGCCILCSAPITQRQTVVYQTGTAQTIVLQHNAQVAQGPSGQVIVMGQATPQPVRPYPGQGYQVQQTYPVQQQGMPYQPQPQQQGMAYPMQQQAGLQAPPQHAGAPQMQPTAPPQYHNDPPPTYDAIQHGVDYK